LRIIPVLDLKAGQVVRAEKGRRDSYRPIVTPLSDGSDPVAVATGLRGLHPFSTFYVADLDAIEGRGSNEAAIARLGTMKKPPDLWLDCGVASEEALAGMLARPAIFPVVGSESQRDDGLLKRSGGHPRFILSLDFFDDGFRGPACLLEDSGSWPATVIVMSLARVGSRGGPDLERLAEIKARAGGRSVVAAGGVRSAADVRTLSSMGIAAALVATSLHDGTLTPRQLASFGN
jgi:phosphoribosylformimino-5-aminoimidazole carboxamide ribotide isomerase